MTTPNEIRSAIEMVREDIEVAKQAIEKAQGLLKYHRGRARQLEQDLSEAIEQESKRAINRDRSAAKRIAKKYSITIEDDSAWDIDGYDMRHWVCQPEWLEGDDPLEDGHFSYDWSDTRWLVEFYAKHHPSHPKHSEREFLAISPWN